MKLPKSEKDLQGLLDYLVTEHSLKREILNYRIKHSPEQDHDNELDPRAFCHVMKGDKNIYCSQSLEHVPVYIRLGLLLHELGHMYLGALDGDESEVKVDDWCMFKIPESGYKYLDQFIYWSPILKTTVTANHLEAVSGDFVYRISLFQD
jgi:hypothetical protein